MQNVKALNDFLSSVQACPGQQIAIVTSKPGHGILYNVMSAFKKARVMSSEHFHCASDMACYMEDFMNSVDGDGNETIVINLSDLNDRWLKATEFDYLLRAFGDMSKRFNNLKRVVLVSTVQRFSLSPATMNFTQVYEVN